MKFINYRDTKILWFAIVFLSVPCLNTIDLSKTTHLQYISQKEAT